MRIMRFMADDTIRLGLANDAGIIDLSARMPRLDNDTCALIEHWPAFQTAIEKLAGQADYSFTDVEVLAPIARPGKIFAIGLNYADHIAEAGIEAPKHQTWFSKAVTAVAAPYSPILRPLASTQVDYEAELVFVVGKRCKNLSVDAARQAIFGYCVGNDVSVRDWQFQSGQFTLGKSFDTHAPFGPWIVTADTINAESLGIRSFVNGELRQDSNTSHLIFKCAEQLAHLSQAMTMEPGDVIFTGTPGGVGVAMQPPRFLKAGDRVRIEIDGIGHLENTVVDEA